MIDGTIKYTEMMWIVNDEENWWNPAQELPLFTINTAGTSPASKIYIYEILNKNSLQRSNQPGLVIEFVHDRFIASSVDITFVYHDVAWVPANILEFFADASKN